MQKFLAFFLLMAVTFSGCTAVSIDQENLDMDNPEFVHQDSDLSPPDRDWLLAWWQRSLPEFSYFSSTWLGFAHWFTPDAYDGEDDTNDANLDLWDVIGEKVTLALDDHPRIQKAANFYARNPRFLDAISVRAEPYFNFILEEIQRRNMPVEVAFLPAIESAYEPRATSPRRAAGLWQMIPGTARHWGLELNRSYDGRRDVFASTHAALDYLQKLNDDFDGDWLLTMAAYNCGELSVARAVRKNIAHGRPTDFWSLDLPAETRAFVPRILGLAAVIAQPNSYGIKLRKLRHQELISVPVDVGYHLDIAQAAEIADLPLTELRRLNPAYRLGKSITAGGNLLLPASHAEAFEERLALFDPADLNDPDAEESNSDDRPEITPRSKSQRHSRRHGHAYHFSPRKSRVLLANNERHRISTKGRRNKTIIAQNRSEGRMSVRKSRHRTKRS